VNLFGAPLYLAEQQGFRKVLDTTFMIGFLLHKDADSEDVKRYFRALQRAQRDIDLEPERYKHYFLKELPAKYHDTIEVMGFGPGERLIFERIRGKCLSARIGGWRIPNYFRRGRAEPPTMVWRSLCESFTGTREKSKRNRGIQTSRADATAISRKTIVCEDW
jgi:hypothetical protein